MNYCDLMECKTTREGNVVVVSASGRLDGFGAEKVNDLLRSYLHEPGSGRYVLLQISRDSRSIRRTREKPGYAKQYPGEETPLDEGKGTLPGDTDKATGAPRARNMPSNQTGHDLIGSGNPGYGNVKKYISARISITLIESLLPYFRGREARPLRPCQPTFFS